MSRCSLDNYDKGFEVVIGWDTGIQSFFVQVIKDGEDQPFIWRGTGHAQLTSADDLKLLIDEIRPFSISFDTDVLILELLKDQKTNDERRYGM
jgi:hypothetical protein